MLAALWPSFRPERIVFEDEDVIVVDKPEGLSTHAPEKDRSDDVHSRLIAYLRERDPSKAPYLGIHQRLDKDTSGVLLFTKRKDANAAIAEQFEKRLAGKTYLAGVTGRRLPDRGDIAHKIVAGKDGAMRALPANVKGGQPAMMRYRVVGRRGERTLLEVEPVTGRTHQIRVQLAAIGAPIAGDAMYEGASAPRLMLHARRLVLAFRGRDQRVEAAPPRAFDDWLEGRTNDPLASIDALEARFRAAADRRYALGHAGDTDAFRIVNGEGDGCAGVTVDVYGEHLVVSLASDEADAAEATILDAAMRLGPAGVYVKRRPKHASVIVDARREAFSPKLAVRGESAPESFVVRERGLPFIVRLGDGLSTGVFLDQRENRARVRELSSGGRVLNLFAYTGAFTVAAIAGGARASTTIDAAKNAIAWAEENLQNAGADLAKHELLDVDAIVWMKDAMKRGERFDLAILDPPSFATTKKTRFSAKDDYAEVAALALALLVPGGKLLACTNHLGISRARFRRSLHDAARLAKIEIAQLKDLADPIDFPPPPGRESHLKSALATVR